MRRARILAVISLALLCCRAPGAHADTDPDEELVCSITAWGLPVAKGVMRIWNSTDFEGRPARRVLAEGETTGIFFLLYRVKDAMESISDPKTLLPFYFRVHFEEGGYRRIQEFRFDQLRKVITGGDGGVLPMLGPTHDPLSAIMFLRSSPLMEGSVVQGTVSDGCKMYPIEAKVVKGEERKVMGKNAPCWLVEPKLQAVELGGLLKNNKFKTFMTWLTQDGDQIPVLAKGDLFLGALLIKLKERKVRL